MDPRKCSYLARRWRSRRILNGVAFLASLNILASYFYALKHKGNLTWLNWANALGAIPLFLVELHTRAWSPMLLTLAFGGMGFFGILKTKWNSEE